VALNKIDITEADEAAGTVEIFQWFGYKGIRGLGRHGQGLGDLVNYVGKEVEEPSRKRKGGIGLVIPLSEWL
jgi:hypothetical protein